MTLVSAAADVLRSTVTGTDVVVLTGTRNVTIAVADLTRTGTVVGYVLSSAVGVSIAIANSTLVSTRYAASVLGSTIRDVVVANVTALSVTRKTGNSTGVLSPFWISAGAAWRRHNDGAGRALDDERDVRRRQ